MYTWEEVWVQIFNIIHLENQVFDALAGTLKQEISGTGAVDSVGFTYNNYIVV